MRNRLRSRSILFFSLFLSTTSAADEPPNALLSLDSLSFVANALDDGEQIPISAIPVRIDSQSGSTWALSIEPADVQLPPVQFNNGDRVQWTLLEPASGLAVFANLTAEVTLTALFRAQSLETSRTIDHRLTFTTRTAEVERDELAVEREGVPLAKASGYVQLVAAGADPPGSDHGIPFFVVLSGRFTSGPPGFISP